MRRVVILAALALAACSSEGKPGDPHATPDSGDDAGPDTGSDATTTPDSSDGALPTSCLGDEQVFHVGAFLVAKMP